MQLESIVLRDVLDRTARQFGSQEAIVAPDGRVTWAELHAQVRQLAAALLRAGVQKGDHVGVLMGNSVEWVRAFYACALLGAVTVPINTRFRLDELGYCLKQADVSTLIYVDSFLKINYSELLCEVEPALKQALPGAALPRLKRAFMVGNSACPKGVVRLDSLLSDTSAADLAALDAHAVQVNTDDLLLIQYTSGTTSFPKGVMLSHQNMLRNAVCAAKRIGVKPDDRYFSIRPFYHVAGSSLSLLVSLVTGACLFTLPTFDVEENLRILAEEKCTLISGNDTIFLMLMGHQKFDPSKLHLRGGWAAAGPEVMQQIHDVIGAPHVCNAYGLSEASPNVVMSSWDDPLPLRVVGMALPHEGVHVRIQDPETGTICAADAPGEIQVRGWNVMRGYYNLPEATAKTFTTDGWLRTGDLGTLNGDGRLQMIGRIKDMFRVGGENVSPREVEETLHAHPAVQMAQVIGVPDQRLGEVPAAYVQLKPGRNASDDELIAWCKKRCANFKVPRYLRVVDSFEHIGMTGSSKVQKNKLREFAIQDFNLE